MAEKFYRGAKYMLNAYQLDQVPLDQGREVAFAGRSNAGKSSAINTLTEINGLARTSKTPGRTQHMVFFELDDERRIVDLPGYGYAKVPRKQKEHWNATLPVFLETRHCLQGVVLLMDIRHPLKELDEAMLIWCANAEIDVHILLTKSDKLKQSPASKTLKQVRQEAGLLHPNVTVQLFSSLKRRGLSEVYARLDQWYGLAVEPDTAAGGDN